MALIKVNNRGQSADFGAESYGRRNYIVNGGFQIWQRGTTLSSVVNTWGPDRFFGTNTSMTWTRTANTFDAPTPYMCVLTGGNSSSRFRFSFELPSSTVQKPFEIGSYWTLSMYTDLDISGKTMNISYANHPNDTPVTASTTGTWVSLGSNRYSLTVQINASNTSNKVGMRFSGPFQGPVGEGVNSISVTGVQFERGQEATPFEERSYGEELQLCQRYYERFGQGWWARFESGSQLVVNGQFKVQKRTAPTIGLPTGGTIRLYEWGVADRDATPTLTNTSMSANGGHFKLSGFSTGGSTGEIWGVGGTNSDFSTHPFEAKAEL